MITGTLKELNVQVGDVVEAYSYAQGKLSVSKRRWQIESTHPTFRGIRLPDGELRDLGKSFIFKLVGRAGDKPKLWGEMTDDEQGALLLARHRGQTIEFSSGGRIPWKKLEWDFDWLPEHAYRVCAVGTVTISGYHDADHSWIFGDADEQDTHTLTFTVQGNEPVTGVFTNQAGATITLEKIK